MILLSSSVKSDDTTGDRGQRNKQEDHTRASATPEDCLADSCICAVYPAWSEGGSVFYYAELCNPSPNCATYDVVYYWDDPLDWPLVCDPGGNPGDCEECEEFMQLRTTSSPDPFPGIYNKIHRDDRLEVLLPGRVPHPTGGGISKPRDGVQSTVTMFVEFEISSDVDTDCSDDESGELRPVAEGDPEVAIAKVFVAQVDPEAADCPKADHADGQRLICIGFEVDPATLSGDEKPLRGTATVAIRQKKNEDGTISCADSRSVQKVEVAGLTFLVLLAEREEP